MGNPKVHHSDAADQTDRNTQQTEEPPTSLETSTYFINPALSGVGNSLAKAKAGIEDTTLATAKNVKAGIEETLATAENVKTGLEDKVTEHSKSQLDIQTFATSDLTSLEDKIFFKSLQPHLGKITTTTLGQTGC